MFLLNFFENCCLSVDVWFVRFVVFIDGEVDFDNGLEVVFFEIDIGFLLEDEVVFMLFMICIFSLDVV